MERKPKNLVLRGSGKSLWPSVKGKRAIRVQNCYLWGARSLSHHNSGWNTIFSQFLWREAWMSDEENCDSYGKKKLVNMFHVKHGTPTQTNPACGPLLVFSPYLVRKHICQYNLFHFLVAEASLVGSQNDTTEEQGLTSMFAEKTQERQHLYWGRE